MSAREQIEAFLTAATESIRLLRLAVRDGDGPRIEELIVRMEEVSTRDLDAEIAELGELPEDDPIRALWTVYTRERDAALLFFVRAEAIRQPILKKAGLLPPDGTADGRRTKGGTPGGLLDFSI